jgi:hypothetical protein
LPYRRLLDELYKMPRIARILALEQIELSDYTTVRARTQTLNIPVGVCLQLSAVMYDTGESVRITFSGPPVESRRFECVEPDTV